MRRISALAFLLCSSAMLPTLVAAQNTTTPDTTAGRPAYFEFQVEAPATVVPGSPAPTYPKELRAQKVEGRVLAQFIVDTTGRPVPATFKVLMSTHDAFSRAVRDALPQMRFTPAMVGDRKVRQVVQMPFTFVP
jgi:protein TonB